VTAPIRIANCSGFYGDRFAAPRELVDGGPIDVLTGDYLAELTMLILWKARERDPSLGYATTFYRQMEEVLGTCLEKGIKIVSNAGGLNPGGLARKLAELADKLGIEVKVAHLEGDDVMEKVRLLSEKGEIFEHLDTSEPLGNRLADVVSANAYLGGFGIAAALERGADVVVTGRVTDASLVVGPAAWHFGWTAGNLDELAGAVVAGHVIECGAQATGGNYSFFSEVPGLEHPGFPIAEVHEDGSAIITKHEGTGGEVSVGTVTAQLLYEIGDPLYSNPDVVADFSTIQLRQEGRDRVHVSGTRGYPPPESLKVSVNLIGGWRNTVTFVLTGLDIDEKADLVVRTLAGMLGGERGFDVFGDHDVRLIRTDRPDAPTNDQAGAQLRVTVKDRDHEAVGRRFSRAAIELALANYPGFHVTSTPSDASAYGVFWPTLLSRKEVEEVIVHHDGTRKRIPTPDVGSSAAGRPDEPVRNDGTHGQAGAHEDEPSQSQSRAPSQSQSHAQSQSQSQSRAPSQSESQTLRVPLGTVVGARSGDKGPNANVGFWARDDLVYAWLRSTFSTALLRELLPEAKHMEMDRYELPNLRALNFVVHGLLGEGVASSTRPDPQAKSLGEYLRSRYVEIPVGFLSEHADTPHGVDPRRGAPLPTVPGNGD
jgi:hypothetical protein